MKLLIGVPSYDYMHAEFVKCLTGLLARLAETRVEHELFIANGTLVYIARDKIASHAINSGFTHVLWLDSDMIFRPTVLEDLTDCGKDFVTGVAHSRRPPFCSCLFKDIRDLNHLARYDLEEYPEEAWEVAGCGFACVLISTEILRAVKLKHKTCFLPEMQWGEDLSFCRRATGMGYQIWAEPCVRLGHIGHEVIWPEDQARYLARLDRG